MTLQDALDDESGKELSQDRLEEMEPLPRTPTSQLEVREDDHRPPANHEPTREAPANDGEPERKWAPDPHPYASVNLGTSADSPHVILLRSHKYKQMQLMFDEKPPEEAIAMLRDAGWKWRGQETGWTLSIERGAEWRAAQSAEHMLRDIGNLIRGQKGLEPVSMPNL
jgi:hypothetical protein